MLEGWVARFLDVAVSIRPVQRITDEKWVWHLGLDAEGSAPLNDLYQGREVGEARMTHLLSLFRLKFAEPSVMLAGVAGCPVYLALAMTEAGRLKLKPVEGACEAKRPDGRARRLRLQADRGASGAA